jgi:hypothetical protein
VPARFYFVAPPTPRLDADGTLTWDEDQPLAPNWLNVWPLEGQLLPGAHKETGCHAVCTRKLPRTLRSKTAAPALHDFSCTVALFELMSLPLVLPAGV